MISFLAKNSEIPLSHYGITLNEESNFFIDNLIKSYSFPITLENANEILQQLGLPNIDNVTNFESSIDGRLRVYAKYYQATMHLGEAMEEGIEATFYFGDEVLPVYDTDLKSLPWPIHLTTTSADLATEYLTKGWPEKSHNFPIIYRPELAEKRDYEDFQLFVNNYESGDFVQNTQIGTAPNIDYQNKNVLTPCPYMLEILTSGFKAAGKQVRGPVLENERLKKVVYIPNNFIEKYHGSTFSNFQFTIPDRDLLAGGKRIGIYEKKFTADNEGSYTVKFNLDFDPVTASHFSFKVYVEDATTQAETTIFRASSSNNRVSLNETVTVNIPASDVGDFIWVELQLTYNVISIAEKNSVEYSYREGRLNTLTGNYSLAEYMPDMTFGEYVNAVKNWLNLDVVFQEQFVTIDFLEKVLDGLPIEDHQHLEVEKVRTANSNRVFKLIYMDKSEVIVDRSGQIYSDLDKQNVDIIDIKMEVQMLPVEQNFNRVTGVYQNARKLLFGIYDGATTLNVCLDRFQGFTGRVENVYELFWKEWLRIRTNNFTFRDSFTAHHSERLELREKIFKYNQLLLPVKLSKRLDEEEFWEVDMVSESI